MEFLRTNGTTIVNESGKEILLEGFGLGGWLLPEGYMWKLYTKCDRPRRMEKLIQTLCGKTYANQFWNTYFDSYITRQDIQLIAEQGFNSVRLPLNSRHLYDPDGNCFIPKSIDLVDQLVQWCTEYDLYVILDMHGAPGGQTGTNIDDSENDTPELFLKDEHSQSLILLWQLLAERYKNEPCIAGYDLLNEPLPNWFSEHNGKVLPLYKEITEAIRQVDQKHMIILEGVHWATNFEIFEEIKSGDFDDNYLLQFHKYWSPPDKESIVQFTDWSRLLNVPLLMGEGGENNLDWYTGFFCMLRRENISYSFWSYKKMNSHNSPVTFYEPEGWNELIDYIDKKTPIAEARAQEIFDSFLENIRNPVVNHSVFNAVNCQVPVGIPAEYYDSAFTGTPREEGAQIRMSENTTILFKQRKIGVPDYKRYGGEPQPDTEKLLVKLHPGDWLEYEFAAAEASRYSIQIHTATDQRAYQLLLDSRPGLQSDSGNFIAQLKPGKHKVRIIAESIILLERIEIIPV